VSDDVTEYVLPRTPVSAGAILRDREGRVLILKPTYKRGWTIPGGQVEADGESPWAGCRREVEEETGLLVTSGRLVCVDFLPLKPERPGGLRFLFDCGIVDRSQEVRVDGEEISEHAWAEREEAVALLSGPVGRRVDRALDADRVLYLEDGRPVLGVST
jgi:8-oxo-dGTP diphosphatase